MAALITCGGRDVQRGRISLGLRGAAWAELEVDGDAPLSGQATIAAAGGLSLSGTIITSGVFLLNTHCRWAAGAGGLGVQVSGAYQFAQLSDPLGVILAAAGEVQSSAIDPTVLAVPLRFFTLGERPAALCLDDLATVASAYLGTPIAWRVLPDGSVWMGAESWPAATLPDGSVIAEAFPAEGRTVIGCEAPSLIPGVDLDGVGRVQGVDHWIEPDRIRSHLIVALDPIERLRSVILSALGLDYTGAPRLDRMARYRSRVVACAADGSTVDVIPDNPRISPAQQVPVIAGAPGVSAVVAPDSVVWLGWEGGDPSKPRAVPDWEAAHVLKLVLENDLLLLGSSGASQPFVLGAALESAEDTVLTAWSTFITAIQAYIAGIQPTADPMSTSTPTMNSAANAMISALSAFGGALHGALSTKIRGE